MGKYPKLAQEAVLEIVVCGFDPHLSHQWGLGPESELYNGEYRKSIHSRLIYLMGFLARKNLYLQIIINLIGVK